MDWNKGECSEDGLRKYHSNKVTENAIQYHIVATAKKYIGQTEKPGNMGFNDEDFERKMKEVGFQKTHAWCSYFAELVWTEGLKRAKRANIATDMGRIFSASATKTFANMKTYQPVTISDEPVPGALAVWQYGRGWQGHIGIVSKKITNDTIQVVEGNTNDKGGREGYIVCFKERSTKKTNNPTGLNLLGFVHPPK